MIGSPSRTGRSRGKRKLRNETATVNSAIVPAQRRQGSGSRVRGSPRRRHLLDCVSPWRALRPCEPRHSVVGDVTRKMVRVAGGKPVWTTLQIAWRGTVPSARKPNVVPRFPTLHELRFMAYQASASGARGLMFFGGHLTQASRPVDATAGWNWTFWELALRPLLEELTSTAVAPALVAPGGPAVTTTAKDVELVTRRDGRFLYMIAVRRGGATSRVGFTGLPSELDGSPVAGGQVLFEYVQEPLPPPIGAGRQVFRSVRVTSGGFRDWFGPHDVHIYRFGL
jgi:hypothetical protein